MTPRQAEAAIRRQRILLLVGILLMFAGSVWSLAIASA